MRIHSSNFPIKPPSFLFLLFAQNVGLGDSWVSILVPLVIHTDGIEFWLFFGRKVLDFQRKMHFVLVLLYLPILNKKSGPCYSFPISSLLALVVFLQNELIRTWQGVSESQFKKGVGLSFVDL